MDYGRTNLAREDAAEEGESVVHRLVVDDLLEVLDEDVTSSRAASSGVTLRPHDADGLSVENIEVHRVKRTLSCRTVR